MINHARSLLLNARASFGVPGDEIIPDDFQPVALNGSLTAVRHALFGAKPDRLMLNYRAQQLLSIVQRTELQEYVTKLDSRLTYDPSQATSIYAHPFGLTFSLLTGDPVQLFGEGVPGVESDVTGRVRYEWRVQLVNTEDEDGCSVVVDLLDLFEISSPLSICSSDAESPQALVATRPAASTETTDLISTSSLSQSVELPGTDYAFKVRMPVGDQLYSVVADVRPLLDAAGLLQRLEAVGEPSQLGLFGIGSQAGNAEPLKTFYQLWRNSDEAPYRLAAATMALIYQTEAARR